MNAILGAQLKDQVKPAAAQTYRADIDGLRAIAVAAVILVHAGAGLSGGFLGVDVFFVISGYLIHRDLLSRFGAGAFSLREFYGRRMRRTLPALYVMIAVCLGAAAFVLMPGDYDALARSAVAAGLSVSNILFLTQAGYFDHAAITKPLLHTWSLGVEEQFYLVAPLISFGLSRLAWPRRRFVYLGLIAAGLAGCVALQAVAAPAAFFLMPARLWEFFIGCAIADRIIPEIRRRWLAELITGVALVALLASMMLVSGASAHPGLPTLVPCLAAAAIIHTGATTRSMVGRALGTRPFVFTGLISYSLYLWHWPLLVLVEYRGLPMTPGLEAALLAALVAVSFLSWKYVERPFREAGSALRSKAPLLVPSGFAVILACSALVVVTRGFPDRFSAAVAKVSSYYDYDYRGGFREGTCFLTTKVGSFRYFDKNICLQKSASRPNYLLIGDSHAAHHWSGLAAVFPDIHFLQATASGCRPVIEPEGQAYCVDLVNYALRDFLPKAKLDGIIFSAAWVPQDAAEVAATVAYAKKFVPDVIVLGGIPTHDLPLPNLISRSLVEDQPGLILAHQTTYAEQIDRSFEKVVQGARYVSLHDLLCPGDKCRVYAGDGVPLQFDTSHLTPDGSIFVATLLKQAGVLETNSSANERHDQAAPVSAGVPVR